MSKGLRILMLGPTGLNKREVADRLSTWCNKEVKHSFKIIDFEKDYLTNRTKGGYPLVNFLAKPVRDQQTRWKQAWDCMEKDGVTDDSSENRILLMHGTIVRGNYGVHCVCDLNRIKDFKADKVITLIESVYNLWWRTESRAFGEYSRGRPTLEQLIMARRTEQVLGDMIAFQESYNIPHLVIAAEHPTETLGRYIFTAKQVVYLAFPISRPREMYQEESNKAGIDAINKFLKTMYEYQHQHSDKIFINPLCIDELPLLECLNDDKCRVKIKEGDKDVECVKFDLSKTWNLEDFYDTKLCLSTGPTEHGNRKPFVREQLENAAGLIRTDVSWRDFRLVMQAEILIAFSPVMDRDRLSRGVEAEILAAISEPKYVYVYQPTEFDPEKKKWLEWLGDPGTMSENIKQQWITDVNSIEELKKRLDSLKE